MKALITGITGQDGYYLSKFLLEKDYEVHGTIRRSSTFNTSRIDSLIAEYEGTEKFKLYYSDLIDSSSLTNLISLIQPDEIYNLAAQSHVAVSFKNPVYTSQTGLGTLNILEAVKNSNKNIKYYQASSSEMYGGANEEKLDEESVFDPKSPYAASKVFAHNMTKIYRESYGLFCVNGILFNHESPRRGESFVTRKITRAATRIKLGLQNKLILGNLDSKRDWGYAKEYVEAMWLMLQQDEPDDYVIATNETHTVREFLEETFNCLDLNFEEFVGFDQKYERPAEVDLLIGDASKAEKKLGWKPKVTFKGLVSLMVEEDMKIAQQEKALAKANLS